MVITELYIRKFGRLSDRHFYLGNGLQIISGDNERYTYTLHAFIRAMLFGLERGRGRAAANDDFTRYEPWDDPGSYGGVMRFTCGGRRFRLDRDFARYTRRASLVCEDDGEELSVEDGDLGMLLGGLTPGVFDSTVSVGQLKSEPGKELSEALADYAANYYETGGGAYNLSGALQVLNGSVGRRSRNCGWRRMRKMRPARIFSVKSLTWSGICSAWRQSIRRRRNDWKTDSRRRKTYGRSAGREKGMEKGMASGPPSPGSWLYWPARRWPGPVPCPGFRFRQERRCGRRCCLPGSRFCSREQ